MRETEILIDQLATDDKGTSRWRLETFVFPIGGAAVLCFAVLALTLGPPLSAMAVIGFAPYLMKLAFAFSVGALGILVLHAAGRPGHPLRTYLSLLSIPFVALLVLAGFEWVSVTPEWPGKTWLRCVTAIGLLGTLVFQGILFAMRSLAPTQLHVTGGVAGIAAGGVAAFAYGFWCPETTATFLLSWYAIPILALGLAGAVLGPRLLHW